MSSDLSKVRRIIGEDAMAQIHASSLPKLETMILLQVWEAGSRAKLRTLVQEGALLTLLKRQYLPRLMLAQKARLAGQNLTTVECLQVAELPLIL